MNDPERTGGTAHLARATAPGAPPRLRAGVMPRPVAASSGVDTQARPPAADQPRRRHHDVPERLAAARRRAVAAPRPSPVGAAQRCECETSVHLRERVLLRRREVAGSAAGAGGPSRLPAPIPSPWAQPVLPGSPQEQSMHPRSAHEPHQRTTRLRSVCPRPEQAHPGVVRGDPRPPTAKSCTETPSTSTRLKRQGVLRLERLREASRRTGRRRLARPGLGSRFLLELPLERGERATADAHPPIMIDHRVAKNPVEPGGTDSPRARAAAGPGSGRRLSWRRSSAAPDARPAAPGTRGRRAGSLPSPRPARGETPASSGPLRQRRRSTGGWSNNTSSWRRTGRRTGAFAGTDRPGRSP